MNYSLFRLPNRSKHSAKPANHQNRPASGNRSFGCIKSREASEYTTPVYPLVTGSPSRKTPVRRSSGWGPNVRGHAVRPSSCHCSAQERIRASKIEPDTERRGVLWVSELNRKMDGDLTRQHWGRKEDHPVHRDGRAVSKPALQPYLADLPI